ncbi:lantibiotic dehydratase [Actinomadura meridiana]|uniref:Lantibiotic dehydratase n=1 Tax=Actinomadura meridiana TaxID=559626 RepID=A0ABP8CG18_9ACTN
MNADPASAPNSGPVRLGESEWSVWSSAMVRGAGFPARAVDRLADPDLADHADQDGAAENPAFRQAFHDATERFTRELGQVAASANFRLAVGWQNRRFLATAVDPHLRQLASGKPANSKRRSREQAIATYWQRYCLKNESIGFFGPTAWATIGTDDSGVTVRPGPAVTDQTTIYLERWPVDVLARGLAADLDLKPWFRPRRSPLLRLTERTACLPGGTPTPIDDLTSALLRAADGTLTARALAHQVCTDSDEAAVFARMEELRKRRWLIWKLELPASLRAEDDLLELLDGIDDEDVRATATARARKLIDGRDKLGQVWNDPEALPAALDDLADTFVELTGAAATRHDGQAYGGRTLAYLECRRDVSVRFGAEFVDRMAPIVPVLDSVRWLTWRIRQDVEPLVETAYRTARQHTDGPVDVGTLWMEAMRTVGTRLDGIVAAALTEFHRRWSAILPYDSDEATVQRTTADLEIAVKELFDAPHSGWDQARIACPDIMIAANGPADVEAGRYRVVLGEIHAAMNSLDYVSMVPTHRDPAALRANLDATFPTARLLPLLPPESRPKFTVRSHPALIRPDDQRISLVPHTPTPRTGTTQLAADALVLDEDGHLSVVLPDGARFDVLDLFAEAMKSLLLSHFDLLPLGRHRPRITVDDLVVTREGWRVPVTELDFVHQPDAATRFVAARAWARANRFPRHVFAKFPTETKPFYVDFASPIFVDVLASAARRAVRDAPDGAPVAVKIVEMLPAPDQAWLTDSAGERYTSEFRFAVCDLRDAAPGRAT